MIEAILILLALWLFLWLIFKPLAWFSGMIVSFVMFVINILTFNLYLAICWLLISGLMFFVFLILAHFEDKYSSKGN